MKSIRNVIQASLSAIAVLSLILISSCGGGGDPEPQQTKQEEVTAQLVGKTWKVQSVQVDGVDKASLFTGMTVAFTGTGFTVTNGGPVWPATGTWTFTSTEATTIKRSDNVEVQVVPTATSLTLTLTWAKTTLGPGKVGSIAGKHVFVFGL